MFTSTSGSRSMKAVVYNKYGSPSVLQIADFARPEAGPNEVQVRVFASSVNAIDAQARSGKLRLVDGLGWSKGTGMDFAGIISSVGPGVTSYQVGDRVWGCRATTRPGHHAAMAEYLTVSTALIGHAPASLGLTEAAALPLVGITALRALRDDAGLTPGDAVLIVGASGGVGSTAMQVAYALGASVVDGVASAANADLVTSLGARVAIDYQATRPTTIEHRYDVILDTAGKDLAAYQCLLKPRGRLVSVATRSQLRRAASGLMAKHHINILRSSATTADLDWLRSQADSRTIKPVIEAEYGLDHVAQAHRDVETGHASGKRVIQLAS